MIKHIPALMALLVVSLAVPSHARAMALSYTTTLDDDAAENVTRGHGAVTVEANPGSDGFTHTFTTPTRCCVLGDSGSTGYGFYDDYLFRVDSGSLSAIIMTLNSGSAAIGDLEARLYEVDPGEVANDSPVLGVPAGSTIGGWSQASAAGTLTLARSLDGGLYSLQVRGNVIGSSGGTYSGVIDYSPVPLPASLPLLMGGCALMVLMGRQRGRVRLEN